MPHKLSDEETSILLKRFKENDSYCMAANVTRAIKTDVFIAGSGPIACTYARTILEKRPSTDVVMAEIGAQDHPIIGANHKNSIKYQKDFDAFTNVIKGSMQPISVPPNSMTSTTLARASWAPPGGKPLVSYGNNPNQTREKNMIGAGITRTVGGMASHWTCSCPTPHPDELKIVHDLIPQAEFKTHFDDAGLLLGVQHDQFDMSIRHNFVKTTLKDSVNPDLRNRGVTNIPLGVKHRPDNPDYLTWSACDTILGEYVKKIDLHTETRVTKLHYHPLTGKIDGAILRDLNTDEIIFVDAKVYVVACGAIGTPQILWNSFITLPALGCYLSDHSLTFCQIVLKREIVEKIRKTDNEEWKKKIEAHKLKYPEDPLPIPFNDLEPQVMIPYHSEFPWHVQIHRDSFQYGGVELKADPRVVVDLRFFGRTDIQATNKVTFPPLLEVLGTWIPGMSDTYGMPQATFEFTRSDADGDRDQRMMKDMTDIANVLGGFLPGAYPQFMEAGVTSHMSGTTRIGNDIKSSVANAESRVHEIDNLWVGGNGCIPDSFASNPTRISMAIALKGANAVVTYLNLPSGKYLISNVAHGKSVGHRGIVPTKLPIVSSESQIWNVKYLKNGLYSLTLNNLATAAEDNLVWSDSNSSGTEWLIEQTADGVNEYTITNGKEGKGWTLKDDDINTQVSLEGIIATASKPPQFIPKQLWSFTPHNIFTPAL